MKPDTNRTEPCPPSSAASRPGKGEVSFCWNCRSPEFAPLFQARDFDTGLIDFPVRRCRQCGLCYTGQVSEAVLAASYSQTYYGSARAKFLSPIEALVKFGHRLQAKKILNFYRPRQITPARTEKQISVLDIGCGRALLLQEFNKLGAVCHGIERSEYPGTGSPQIDIHTGALEDAVLAGKCFDIIILWHVLEHITELGSLLEELPKHLNPGGLLVVSVPNFLSWQSQFFKRHWFHLDIPRHVAHFEKNWLETKLAAMGLTIISVSTVTASQNLYGFIQSSMNKLVPQQPNRLYKLLTQAEGRRDWPALIVWVLLALPLAPIAVLETLLTAISNRGATLTIYARNKDQSRHGADVGKAA